MTLPAAGWYPDPDNASQSRWWNGVAWTENRTEYVGPMPAATPASYSMNASPLTAPEGTPWNTVWIWLIIFVPYIPTAGIFLVDWPSMLSFTYSPMSSGMATLGILASPAYLLTSLGGFVVYGLAVWFAYLDYRELERRSVPRPFHWAWTFLSSGVYPIGRSVIVRRRTGRGISPMWVTIALMVLSFIFSIAFSVWLMSLIFEQIPALTGYGV